MEELKEGFQKYFRQKVVDVSKIDHKGNNRLFKIIVNDGIYLLKQYSRKDEWDRGLKEARAVEYLNEKNLDVPWFIDYYPDDSIGIYSFEEGRILDSKNVSSKHISIATDFLTILHNLPDSDKLGFSTERTAALSFREYFIMLEKRFYDINCNFCGNDEGKRFFNVEIKDKMNELKDYIYGFSNTYDLDKRLMLNEQVLTPGDFGFHNMLYSKKSKFIDFEYFGRDDHVKDILVFLHHDKNLDLKRELKEQFVNEYIEKKNPGNLFEDRLRIIDPLIGMSWALTYAGILNKKYLEHLKFSHGDDLEKLIDTRLEKAKIKLNNLKFFD